MEGPFRSMNWRNVASRTQPQNLRDTSFSRHIEDPITKQNQTKTKTNDYYCPALYQVALVYTSSWFTSPRVGSGRQQHEKDVRRVLTASTTIYMCRISLCINHQPRRPGSSSKCDRYYFVVPSEKKLQLQSSTTGHSMGLASLPIAGGLHT